MEQEEENIKLNRYYGTRLQKAKKARDVSFFIYPRPQGVIEGFGTKERQGRIRA